MLLQNLENKIKFALIISSLSIIGSLVFSLLTLYKASNMIKESHSQIYVVKNGIPLEAIQESPSSSKELLAKSLVSTFHQLFLTLPPDDEYIQNSISKALYLIDESGKKQHNALIEKGFYNTLILNSTSLNILTDSIKYDSKENSFIFYGKERFQTKNSVYYRSLITAGKIIPNNRSDNNPYGLIITDYKTLANIDL